jgi:hypothetical protein
MGTKNVRRDRRREVASILFTIRTSDNHTSSTNNANIAKRQSNNALVLNVDKSLGVGITKVALMWRSLVDLFSFRGTRHSIGEDASRKTRDEFDVVAVRRVKDVFVNEKIVAKEREHWSPDRRCSL